MLFRSIHCTDSSFEESTLNAVKNYQFKPATTKDGKSVPVTVPAVLQYHQVKFALGLRMIVNTRWMPNRNLIFDRHMSKAEINRELSMPVHYGFIPQRGGASVPDSDGIYPLTRSVTAPRVVKFIDEGYGSTAFTHEGNNICDVLLTISTKGKASDPQIAHCERPELEKPALASLLKSLYKPGMVNGKEVPMRASLHLDYGDAQSTLAASPALSK